MTESQHKIEVEKLDQLEKKLIELVFNQDAPELHSVFDQWITQRNVCNEGYVQFMDNLLNEGRIEKSN